MPWKTSSLAEARKRFVQAAQRGLKSVAQLCREHNISRKTGFKWLRRFHTQGGPGLQNRSRRPKRSPGRIAIRWIRAIAQTRRKHPSWGAKKIYARLRSQHPRADLPKVRTITDWLKRLKLAQPRRVWARRGPTIARSTFSVPAAPNDVWTVDFKGWFRTCDGQRVDPLTVRDLFSRFILGIGLLSFQHEPVRRYFQGLFARYGQPKVIRVDHGRPFAGDGALDLSRLSAWRWELGSSSLVVADRRTTRPMNRCIESIRPKWLRHQQPTAALNSGVPPAGWPTTISPGPMRHWTNARPPPSTARAGELIAGRSAQLTILVNGPHVGSPAAATFAGAPDCESSVGPLANTASASNRLLQVFMRSISCAISSENCTTMTRAVCGQLGGPKLQTQNLHRNLCPCLQPSPMSPPRAGKSALRLSVKMHSVGSGGSGRP